MQPDVRDRRERRTGGARQPQALRVRQFVLLGSVSQHLLHRSPCTVAVVREIPQA
ncbi:universal stress protein [Micromonospora sp. PSH03]|uniref:universal stress protein n=1 Tax=Micromonospora TaxID=1873 RepID=UPI001EE88DA5|nr:universal stress protein [Micromonospora salmantinae]MCG5454727.1 universal stress protein [Micromonospora salmantinae]